MKILLILSLILTVFTINNALADEVDTAIDVKVKKQEIITPTINENWYIFFDTAAISHSFAGDFSDKKEDLEKFAPNDKDSGMVGFGMSLAFYFPFNNHKTMFGPYLAGGLARNEISNNEGDRFAIDSRRIDLAASVQHYFGPNIGSGFFVRGDLGASYSELRFTYESGEDCFIFCFSTNSATVNFRDGTSWEARFKGDDKTYEEVSSYALVGAGYSFGLGRKVRMQLMLNHSYRPSSLGAFSSTNLSLGMLF